MLLQFGSGVVNELALEVDRIETEIRIAVPDQLANVDLESHAPSNPLPRNVLHGPDVLNEVITRQFLDRPELLPLPQILAPEAGVTRGTGIDFGRLPRRSHYDISPFDQFDPYLQPESAPGRPQIQPSSPAGPGVPPIPGPLASPAFEPAKMYEDLAAQLPDLEELLGLPPQPVPGSHATQMESASTTDAVAATKAVTAEDISAIVDRSLFPRCSRNPEELLVEDFVNPEGPAPEHPWSREELRIGQELAHSRQAPK